MKELNEAAQMLWEQVLCRYDRVVLEGGTVVGEEFGALMVAGLSGVDPELDTEAAGIELEERIRRYHLDVCLEHVQAKAELRPSQRLLTRCFKGWPVSPRVMLRKLMSVEMRRRKGKPVHGVQQVDLGNALFDRIAGDAHAEVMMTQERLMPDTATVRTAAHGHAVPVLTALLRTAGLRHRQIAQLLATMGALKEASDSAQEKLVQRAALDGEMALDGQVPAKRRSLGYTHHPILEFLIGDEAFLEQLTNDPDGAAAMLVAIAPDLRAMKVRMALVDFSPTVVNAFRTLERDQWPPVLQRLCDDERAILADYGAERLTRTDAELALGRRGASGGAPAMRPAWRMFVASSLTRMALQDRADAQDVLREVRQLDEAVQLDIDNAPGFQRAVAQALAEYSRAYLCLDRVDLAILAKASETAETALQEAETLAHGHPRLQHDLLLRALTLEVQKRAGTPAALIADAVAPVLQRFVAACDTPALAADNIRQYLLPIAPNVARVLAERTALVQGSVSSHLA